MKGYLLFVWLLLFTSSTGKLILKIRVDIIPWLEDETPKTFKDFDDLDYMYGLCILYIC